MSPSRLEVLHPAWFASLMSTAGVALAFLLDPYPTLGIDEALGMAFLASATLLGGALVIAFGARSLRHFAAVSSDLGHPVFGPLTAALPAGLMVLAVAVAQAGVRDLLPAAAPLAFALLLVGLLGTVALGFTFYIGVVNNPDNTPQAMTGAWFIPVVPLVLVPNALVRLVSLQFFEASAGLALLAISVWGAGILLFVILAAAVGHRLLTLPPPPAAMAATWWIWLAPAGAGGLGALASADLLAGSGLLDSPVLLWPVAMTLFGFGTWWLLFASALLWRQRKRMHFHLGTWGFGFPSAAMSALTLALGARLALDPLEVVGGALIGLTLPLWLYLAWRTGQGMLSGKVFQRA